MSDLIGASKTGDLVKVISLLTNGADVNARDDDDSTPLHHACINGHKQVVEILLAGGADVNARNIYGNIPLHYACPGACNVMVNDDGSLVRDESEVKYMEIVEMLIASRADVNITTDFCWHIIALCIHKRTYKNS